MQNKDVRDFFAAYHAAVFSALDKDDIPRVNAMVGSILASTWLKTLERSPANEDEFKESLEGSMTKELKFSDTAELSFGPDGAAALEVTGCVLCHGNDLLRSKGASGVCPVSQFVKSAMGRSLKKDVELAGVEKPGPVGECRLNYKTG